MIIFLPHYIRSKYLLRDLRTGANKTEDANPRKQSAMLGAGRE